MNKGAWKGLVILILLVLTPFHPVLFKGKTLQALPGLPGFLPNPGGVVPPVLDTSSAYIDEPLARLAKRQIREGKIPLWNPHAGMGQPLLGNMQSAILSPFRWPIIAFDSPLIWDLTLVSRIVLAGVLAYLLALSFHFSVLASLFTGIAFSLTGYFVLYVNMHHLSVEVLLPGFLLALKTFMGKPSRTKGLLLSLTTWLIWVGGNPEATILILVTGILFFILLKGESNVSPLRTMFHVLCGTLLAFPFILPGLEHLLHGQHHHGGATGMDHFRPWTVAGLFLPRFYMDGKDLPITYSPPWIGTSVILLAFGYLVFERKKNEPFPGKVLLATASVFLLKVFGMPLLNETGRLPGLSLILFHKYFFPDIVILLSLVGGKTIDSIKEAGGEAQKKAFWGIIPGVGVLLLIVLNRAIYNKLHLPYTVKFDPFYGLWVIPAFVGILAGLGKYPRVVSLFLVIFTAAELCSAVPGKRPERRNPFEKPGFLGILEKAKKTGEPTRCVSFQDIFLPNTSSAVEVDDIRINDAIIIERFALFAKNAIDGMMQGGVLSPGLFSTPDENILKLAEFFQSKWFFRKAYRELKEKWRNEVLKDFVFGSEAMDASGITHLLAMEPGSRRGDLARSNPSRWKLEGVVDGVTVYRNKKCPGRAFVPARIFSCKTMKEAVLWVRKNRNSLTEKAIIEQLPDDWPRTHDVLKKDTVKCFYDKDGVLCMRTDFSRPSVVLVSEVWFPGRKVLVDGRETAARPGDLCFTAFKVPPGKHLVRVMMEFPSFKTGLIFMFAGILLAFIPFLAPRGSKAK